MAGDIESAYYAKRGEELVEGRAERMHGYGTIIAGIGVLILAFSLVFIRWPGIFVVLLIIGAFLIATGVRSVNRDARRASAASQAVKPARLTVSPAALKPHHVLTRPHTLIKHSVQRTIARPFLPDALRERERIRKLISGSSGEGVSALYARYSKVGGTLDAPSFVQAVHALQKEGFISVEEHVRQARK